MGLSRVRLHREGLRDPEVELAAELDHVVALLVRLVAGDRLSVFITTEVRALHYTQALLRGRGGR